MRVVAEKVTDLPTKAVWLAHIVDKLTLGFGGHLQYSDVFTGRHSLADEQFVRIISARADDTGNPLEIDEIWCGASRLGWLAGWLATGCLFQNGGAAK